MGLLMDSAMLAPLKDAQEDLGVRLDALLVELRTIRVLLETVLDVPETVSTNGSNGSNGSKKANGRAPSAKR